MLNNKLSRRGGGNLSSEDNKHTNEDLKIMQSWNLETKIQVTQTRILEWYKHYDGNVYVSFSGGKDSTALAYLAAQVCNSFGYKLVLWFSDTGLEFPEVKTHVINYDLWLKEKFPDLEIKTVIDYPTDRQGNRVTFKKNIEKYGYPIISKHVAKRIKEGRLAIKKGNNNAISLRMLRGEYGNRSDGGRSKFNCEKYKYLLDAPFKISHQCCDAMKKRPAHKFEKKTGLKPIIGTMAYESMNRKNSWRKFGCNIFDEGKEQSRPLSFWKENDVLEFINKYNIPYASIYGEIKQDETGKYYTTGWDRTGCVFCAFGVHLEKEPNRFQRLKQTHPKLWNYCMKPWDEGGLGMKEVLDYIGVKYE